MMYFMISLTALLAAIWVGIWFAGRFVAPIRRLISAAQQVTKGNLKVELPIRRGEGDLRRLSMNFNTMTKELERQRTDLVTANTPAHRAAALHGGGAVGRVGRRASASIATVASRLPAARRRSCSVSTAPSSSASRSPRPCRSSQACSARADEHKGRPQHQVTLIIAGEERNFSVRVTHEERARRTTARC